MKIFSKALVVLTVIAMLSVGIFTTALASETAEEGSTDTSAAVTLEEAKAELEASTPLKQYDLPVVIGPLTWEAGNTETTDPKSWGEMLGSNACNDIGVEYEENGNGHFTIRYHGEEEAAYEATNGNLHTYAYISLANRNKSNDIVMEFDLTTFGDALPSGMGIEHHSAENENGGRSQPSFLSIRADGTINPNRTGSGSRSGYTLTDEEKANLAKYVITKGEWMHFTIIYNTSTYFATLYINYEYVCHFDTRPADVSRYDLSVFRFGSSNGACADGEISIDNFIAYEGSYVRTPDLFINMTEHEKFIFYTEYMQRETASTGDRVFAYERATEMLSDYYGDGSFIPVKDASMDSEELAALNAELEATVTEYNGFVEGKYAELYQGYIEDNLTEFGALTAELSAMERTLATIADRSSALTEVNAFLSNVGDNILKTEDSSYAEVKRAYDAFVQNLSNDERIVRFCDVMDNFESAMSFSYETLQKHYSKAQAFVQDGIDKDVLGVEGYERFTEAYGKFIEADEILDTKLRAQNAKKIIDCVSFIRQYDTVELWEANYDYINKYVVLIRDEVRRNNYDVNAEGIEEALAFFDLVDEYFYGLLQMEHADVLLENLDLYAATDGYVEKVGICAYLRSYIASADIDLEHEQIAPLILRLDIYESELEQYKVDYNEVLIQNTAIFASTIHRITTVTTYSEMYELYQQARQLYFAMNVGDESIADELALYDELTEYFDYVETVSSGFLVAVEALKKATTEDEKFAALVECYRYSHDAETSLDGVAEAMEYYLAEYEAYNSVAVTANGELDSVVVVSVGALRANCGSCDVVAIIVKKICEG